ncbi:sensor histidine kinase [Mycobacterium vicinigordonae]|uniref:sensor histidine kinase n=1 Tax=Mycobacterium vicinigordonae TaxID=1719132 RepID=UPI001FECB261|nr:HAMP domain-containing sensor histidine kinase [Mycobacterium vicinigordonae]
MVVAIRFAVVVSIGILVSAGPPWMRGYTAALIVVLAVSLGYASALMAFPRFEVRHTSFAWLLAAADAILTLILVGLTGGPASPVVLVLALVVISSAARLTFPESITLAVLVGVGYVGVIAYSPGPSGAALPGAVQGVWWALYLVFIAVLSGGLSVLIELEHRSRVKALVEAEVEHAAAEEERDLRSRLLRSYEAQQEGLQVLLHEFRTPVTSLDALACALTDGTPMTGAAAQAALTLAGRHARHLSDMLDALSDVNLSRQPTFSSGRVRRVSLTELVAEAGDAAGVIPPRLRVSVHADVETIHIDAQGLRRVLTNLLENATRHGRGRPIDVICSRDRNQLHVAVLDRGPGVPASQMQELTSKFVRLSDRHGTAGLGLWIVAQIIDALGGSLTFTSRDEGGFTASFSVPVE